MKFLNRQALTFKEIHKKQVEANMENVKIMNDDISTNNKNLVAMARRHLCQLATPINRKYMEDLKFTLCECGLDIGLQLVPDCVYRCGCVKENGCRWFDKAAKENPNLTSTNIRLRYETYYDLIKK